MLRIGKGAGLLCDVLKLNGGDWREPFWTAAVAEIRSRFPVRLEGVDGYQRFRVAYVEPRRFWEKPAGRRYRNEGLVADNGPRAEVYSAATKRIDHDPVP